MRTRGDVSIALTPELPCRGSPTGFHDWAATPAQPGGAPLPGARTCLLCGAFDSGPYGLRVSHRDSPIPIFPAATRSFRQIDVHDPDDPSPDGVDPNSVTGL